jgi:hypothetical protein
LSEKNHLQNAKFFELLLDGFNLESPFVYNNEIGIRFELGLPYRAIHEADYFKTMLERSSELFHFLFSDSDNMVLIRKTSIVFPPYEIMNPGVNVYEYVDNALRDQVVLYEDVPAVDEDSDEVYGRRMSFGLVCPPQSIRTETILQGIGYADHPHKGDYISDRIYFVHPKKKIIYHMYDDRGLDIVALDREALRPVYLKYHDWILDYDREWIDKIFN